jgi:hypothetical protein
MKLELPVAGYLKDRIAKLKMEKKESYFCLNLEGNVSKHGNALSRAFSTSGNSSCG